MTTNTEREIETPCGWCGNAIVQPTTGRRRHYCDRSCRQRAYELRAAQRRHQADVDTGRIRSVPAPKIIERTVQPRHPTTAAQWEHTLTALAEQLRDGRHAWERHRIHAALNTALTALGDPMPAAATTPASAAVMFDDALAAAVAAVIACTDPDGTDTTLTRLQARTGHPTPLLRDALRHLAVSRYAVLRRHGVPVDDVDELAEHARFRLCVGPF
ncbi:hypothetical protein [Micromonospora sp. WMMD737]|uniref:hypothetical protein n=1 Tax=Micromonospora sp. WMMD737 TaxID=3404113 RepID=UPI003B93A2CD